jgi:hypothetical protein
MNGTLIESSSARDALVALGHNFETAGDDVVVLNALRPS